MPTLASTVVGFTVAYRHPELAQRDQILGALLVSWKPLALSMTIAVVVPMVSYAAAGILLFVRRGDDWVAMLTSVGFITAGATVTRSLSVLVDHDPTWLLIVRPIWTVALLGAVFIACLFPDGRFVPSWTKRVAVAAVLTLFVFPNIPVVIGRSVVLSYRISSWYERGAVLASLAYTVLAMLAQGIRYRRISGQAERRRSRRLILSIAIFVTLMTSNWVLHLVAPGVAERLLPAIVLVGVVPAVFTSLTAVDVVVRGGLFDMDVVATRTLLYGGVTALLGVAYVGAIVLFEWLFKPLTRSSDFAVASATLTTAVLIRPVFTRVRSAVERRFNRSRYDAVRTIDEFAYNLRRQIDIDSMGAELVEVVSRTMQPSTVWVWLR